LRSVESARCCCSMCLLGKTHDIDTPVSRNGDDGVQRPQINAHDRHVYAVAARWRGTKGLWRNARGAVGYNVEGERGERRREEKEVAALVSWLHKIEVSQEFGQILRTPTPTNRRCLVGQSEPGPVRRRLTSLVIVNTTLQLRHGQQM
jgi:hypothetical protein